MILTTEEKMKMQVHSESQPYSASFVQLSQDLLFSIILVTIISTVWVMFLTS